MMVPALWAGHGGTESSNPFPSSGESCKPSVPERVYNPARAEVSTEHVFAIAMNDVINNGMTPEAAIDKAFRRCEAIFAKYPIVQA